MKYFDGIYRKVNIKGCHRSTLSLLCPCLSFILNSNIFCSTCRSFPPQAICTCLMSVLWFLDLAYGFISFHCYHFIIISYSLVSENKPPSVVSVLMAFIGTLNLPTHLILTTFNIIYHLLVGQLLLLFIIICDVRQL